jgi:hypothetical protein
VQGMPSAGLERIAAPRNIRDAAVLS